VLVAHALEILRGQGGTESAAAIKNDFRFRIRNGLLDIALDYAFPQMNGTGDAATREFAFFAHVHKEQLLACVQALLHLLDGGFADAFLGFVDQGEKAVGVLHRGSLQRLFRAERITRGGPRL
jgi:hypothetical protein